MSNKKRLADVSVFIRDLTAMKSMYDAISLDGIIKALKEAPTVDAVEVVRCSDCRHWDEIEDTCGGGYCNHSCWVALDAEPPVVNHSDFCSYGERRTDND